MTGRYLSHEVLGVPRDALADHLAGGTVGDVTRSRVGAAVG